MAARKPASSTLEVLQAFVDVRLHLEVVRAEDQIDGSTPALFEVCDEILNRLSKIERLCGDHIAVGYCFDRKALFQIRDLDQIPGFVTVHVAPLSWNKCEM